MNPYKIEIIWKFDDEYMIVIYDRDFREIARYDYIKKEYIPSALEKYLCVGAWEVK